MFLNVPVVDVIATLLFIIISSYSYKITLYGSCIFILINSNWNLITSNCPDKHE